MIYRDFGKTGMRVSPLGFGCMRLPMTVKDGNQVVDDDLATPLLLRAVELGINFFDSAWFYCNHDSQRAVGKALRDVRDKVIISSKLPLFNVKKSEDFDEYLDKTLEQMGLEYLDINHFHGLTYRSWQEQILPLKLIDRAEKAKSKGLIKHLSFSFHGDADKMSELIDTGAFSSLLGQYNLVDKRNEIVFEYARAKGMGTAVMGPLMGGALADGGDNILKRMGSDASSAAEMGLRFVWSLPTVDMALSGMSNMQQLEENVRYAEAVGSLGESERKALLDKVEELEKLNDIYCTSCNYCDVCPEGIKPGRLFQLYIQHMVWGLDDTVRRRLSGTGPFGPGNDASLCTACGECKARCPQKIEIPKELKRVWPKLAELRGA